MDIKSKISQWTEKPYDQNMDVFGWFIFLGLLSVISLAWASILKRIQES